MSTNSGRSSLSVLETSFLYTSSSSEEDLRLPLKTNSTQHKREKLDDEKFKRPAFVVTKSYESNSSSNLSSSANTSLNVTSSSNTSSSVSSCADSFSRFLRTPLSGKTHRRGRHSTCTSQIESNRNTQGSSLSVDEHNIEDDPFNTTFCYTPANETQRSNSSSTREEQNSSRSSVSRKLNLGSHISKSRPALTLNSIKAHLTPKRPSLQQKKSRRQSAAPTDSSASSINVSQSDWCKSLESVLSDPERKNSFLQFLKKEFSEENLEFWSDVQDLKQVNGRSKVKQKVKDIYLTYIIEEAPKMLNLTMPVRLTVASNVIKNPADKDCFAQAEESIFNLMNNDSFRRFQNSV